MKILMLVGSLRTGSWTGELVGTLPALLPAGVEAAAYDGLADLPHYDQDLDGDDAPAAVVAFREALRGADALVVATPEYNGSIPGVLKNAVDWASRPRGASPLDGLPAAVVSVSPSPRGAQWAREDLVKVLRVAGAVPLEDAVGVATVHETVVDGRIADAEVETALRTLVGRLVDAGRERPAA
ncbi:NAD(P)H-dependent FMN reductase [Nocardioides scoriae]|uniref:NAD(P)H-dependent FMN reductase n=1 Tax=Nocardioides scoriae TaxID=642780 RepID=A0A1H1UES8_9ACTN|nr:NAD(P)H-dependent oxidoreductase [Nocardioides scoriae]SDS70920.1 NAD(P)H-dependent FMN reductase [Nocardioides scoriae]